MTPIVMITTTGGMTTRGTITRGTITRGTITGEKIGPAGRIAMFDYDFMRHAFAAAAIVALVAGLVGYFLVLRGQTFAGHALAHVGFTGATGAVLVGASPLAGLVVATVAAGIGMGFAGERLAQRDVAIGMVLSLSLGFGLLFLHFFTAYATQVTALLFGNVLAVDTDTLVVLLALGVLGLAALGVIARPLLFASLQPELAEAKGVNLRLFAVLVRRSLRWRRPSARRSSVCCWYSP
jgi:zinc/manganese transport system permease protein